MATTTTRWALVKPAAGDTVNVSTQIDAGMDIIDAALGSTPCTAITRPGSPVNGQVIFQTDTYNTFVWHAADATWLSMMPLTAFKAANKTVNNSTTLSADSELVIAVEANTSYLFEAYLEYSSATTPDAKFSITTPAGATWSIAPRGLTTGVAATSGSIETAPLTTGGIALGGNGAGTHLTATPSGQVTITGTAGNVTLTWAQNTANVSDTVLYAGSWMRLTRY